MDLTRLEISRRTALLTSAAIAANVVNPMRAFAEETPRKGGVFNVHYGAEQRQLNPSLQASTGVYIIGGKIQENLVDLDSEGKPVGVLAESWEASPDGKTITFKLRKGITWHDGKPFTSADVEFTAMNMWKKILNYGSTLQLFLTGVDTPDAQTAIFRYERPMPLNLLLRALPDLGYVSPKHLYESGDIRQNPTNLAPVGTGPFKFVKYERGQYVIADRNPDYWRAGAPYLDRIVWRVITDRAAAAAQMEAGELHYSPFSGLTISDMARLGQDKRFIVTTKGNEGNARTNTIEFNVRRKELSDIRVRRAIAHAINVPFFIDNFSGISPRSAPGRSRPPRPTSIPGRTRRNILTTRRRRRRFWTKPDSSAVLTARASRCGCCRRPGARISRCGRPSSSNRCPRSAYRSISSATTAAASSSRSMTTTPSTSPPAGTSIATIPRSRPRCGIARANPRAHHGPTNGDGKMPRSTRPSTMPQPKSIPSSARRFMPSSSAR
jgi:hypothetical protein